MEIYVIGIFNEYGGTNKFATTDKLDAMKVALDLVDEMNEYYDEKLELYENNSDNIYKLWALDDYKEQGVYIEKYNDKNVENVENIVQQNNINLQFTKEDEQSFIKKEF